MNLVFLGPPGCGKGTQAMKVAEKHGLPQISAGDILREAVQNGLEDGLKAKPFMDAGRLVPDETVVKIVTDRLRRKDCANGFILDGFPRTVPQAESLGWTLAGMKRKIDVVFDFDVPEEELIKRIAGRKVCKKCRVVYNVASAPPSEPGVCDKCGGGLFKREDDNEEAARERFRVYKAQSDELGLYYHHSGRYCKLDGAARVDEIFGKIEEIIGEA
ncbi:MAG: adenylate kinase [Nitrospinae bacterium]|nr:adenylate kinase [Nitrospinota bacterium]